MAAKPLVEQLMDRVAELTRIVLEHQAFIVAFAQYQREQPTYDVGRFGTLYAEQRARMQLPTVHTATDPDAALQALFAAYTGPVQ